jgi:hypothetical protein
MPAPVAPRERDASRKPIDGSKDGGGVGFDQVQVADMTLLLDWTEPPTALS